MPLPRWNNAWEKPDPLRGGRGWVRHHYISAAVAAALLFLTLGSFLVAAAKAHRQAAELKRDHDRRQAERWNPVDAAPRFE